MWERAPSPVRVEQSSTTDHMSYYHRNLPHIQADDRFHLITFCIYERGLLPTWARDLVLSSCLHDHDKKYDLAAAVIMPDHVHLVLWPLIDRIKAQAVSLQRITQALKGVTAHTINQHANRCGPVWQDESFDHVIRRGFLTAKILYVLENPVRKELAHHWKEYRWNWCNPKLLEQTEAARKLREQ